MVEKPRKKYSKKENTFEPSDAQKARGLEHIRYEISMLYWIGCHSPWHAIYGTPIHTAIFEGFLLHVRTLLEFFTCKDRYKDSILASDYKFETPSTIPDDIKHDLDKYLAHLTYSRTERPDPDQEWIKYVTRFLPGFLDVCIQFVDSILHAEASQVKLPEDKRDRWQQLSEHLRDWRKSIQDQNALNHTPRNG